MSCERFLPQGGACERNPYTGRVRISYQYPGATDDLWSFNIIKQAIYCKGRVCAYEMTNDEGKESVVVKFIELDLRGIRAFIREALIQLYLSTSTPNLTLMLNDFTVFHRDDGQSIGMIMMEKLHIGTTLEFVLKESIRTQDFNTLFQYQDNTIAQIVTMHSYAVIHNDLHAGNIGFRMRDDRIVIYDWGRAVVNPAVFLHKLNYDENQALKDDIHINIASIINTYSIDQFMGHIETLKSIWPVLDVADHIASVIFILARSFSREQIYEYVQSSLDVFIRNYQSAGASEYYNVRDVLQVLERWQSLLETDPEYIKAFTLDWWTMRPIPDAVVYDDRLLAIAVARIWGVSLGIAVERHVDEDVMTEEGARELIVGLRERQDLNEVFNFLV